MKDAVATMGALLPDDAAGRDAVHVAVFSAHSARALHPGQCVAIVTHGEKDAEVSPLGELVGIVDPFLGGVVMPGERFWVYLYPRTITALSHRWSHPAFEDVATTYAAPSEKLASELWLAKFCAEYRDRDYGFDMMEVLREIFDGHYGGDEYLTIRGNEASGPIPYEVWHHASVVFGKPVPVMHPTYFSCSC